MTLPTLGQEHLLIRLLLVRVVLFSYHQDRAVSVPNHRVRDAAHEGSLDAAKPPASQHYQSCTDVLPYSEDPLVWSSHPEMGTRNDSPGRLDPLYLLIEQALPHVLDLLLVCILSVEAHSAVLGGILRTQDESHV